jgi:hypothetical protein
VKMIRPTYARTALERAVRRVLTAMNLDLPEDDFEDLIDRLVEQCFEEITI